jgi:hypothetical protein
MQPVQPLTLAAALGLLVAGVAIATPREPIDPGYWETTNRVLSPMRTTKTERRCIGPAQVAKFMEGPGNHIYRCTYPTKVFRDGEILLKGTCRSRNSAPFPIEGRGSYSHDSFHLDAHASAPFGPIHLPIHAVTDARRLGDSCPAREPPPTSDEAGNAEADRPATRDEVGNGEADQPATSGQAGNVEADPSGQLQ